ncbi:MAG: cytochrome c [Casimicrobiaceae bacterium]
MKAMWLSVGMFAVFAVVGAAGTAHAAGDVQAGKAKSASCAGCHGANGEGKGAYPALAGRTEHEISEALEGYKSGAKNNAIMHSFASHLSDQVIQNLAAYYASLTGK